jgi:hypothetical protein
MPPSTGIPEVYNKFGGVGILCNGPRGGVQTDSWGRSASYRIFRIELINDSMCPMNVTLKIPDKVPLLPDSNQFLKVFLFPDSLTPHHKKDTFNFGVTGLDSILFRYSGRSELLRTRIQPKKERIIYIGVLTEGLARAYMFIRGFDSGVPFLPQNAVMADGKNKDVLKLIFAIGIDPPRNYALVDCGQIVFGK